MALDVIHLRKLLKLLFLPQNILDGQIRSDIRQEIARELGTNPSGGGDFHTPFWSDARDHAFHIADLHTSTEERITANQNRLRLYPLLRDGFLLWWNERRRWTNEPFIQIVAPSARYSLPGIGVIKLENMLAVRDAAGVDHFVYPYFAERPVLSEDAARLGLWVLSQGFPQIDSNELRILDVLRGRAFSLDRSALVGNEEETLNYQYQRLMIRHGELRKFYE